MTSGPSGMVDELAAQPRTQTPFETAILQFLLAVGTPDADLVRRVSDPAARAGYAQEQAARRETDWAGLGYYRGENAAQQARGAPDIVFIGDSITEIWRHADPALFSDGVVGRGIAGQTTPQTLIRFYADVVALRPRAVHVMCGGNDIAGNTGPTTPRDFQNNMTAMADLAAANGIRLALGSIVPAASMPWRPAVKPLPRIAQLNLWLREFAAARGAVFADYHGALVAADGSLPPHLANDGVHPNAAGYALMRPVALAAMARVLERSSPSSTA